jgi:hypothetical protein
VTRVVYIAGYGRSGTTLAGRLLGSLPGAADTGELVHLWRRGILGGERCGCGATFGSCPFWRQVGAVTTGWSQFEAHRAICMRNRVDRSRFIPLLASPVQPHWWAEMLDEYQAYFLRVYDTVRELSGAQVVIDSSKHASLAHVLARCPWIDLRIIHMVRDPRAVAYSWTKPIPRPDAGPGRTMRTYRPVISAGRWVTQNTLISLLPSLRVRYEDLADKPAETLAAMAAYAGLDPDPSPVHDGWADLRQTHSVSGHPSRLKYGPVPIARDDTWQAKLSRPARAAVTAVAGPLMPFYGY